MQKEILNLIEDLKKTLEIYDIPASVHLVLDSGHGGGVKVTGDFYTSAWHTGTCPEKKCQTKLRTDGKFIWCSNVTCGYIQELKRYNLQGNKNA